MKIIKQAAEAIIFLDKDKVIKERIRKSYRIDDIDNKLRKFRTRSEGKLLEKIDNSPEVYELNDKEMKRLKGDDVIKIKINYWLIVILSCISFILVFYLIFNPNSIFRKGNEPN